MTGAPRLPGDFQAEQPGPAHHKEIHPVTV
jgi:hypothetical protein